MQPQDPPTGPFPPAPAVPPATAPPPGHPAPRRSRARLWLALIGGILALLCLGAGGIFVTLYDGATKINRAEPDAVTSSFLRAYLSDRNDKEASLFTCKQPKLDAIAALRAEMVNREKTYGTSVTANWGSVTVSGSGQSARSAAVDLAIIGSSNGQQVSSHTESWNIGLVEQSGWRVCSATKAG